MKLSVSQMWNVKYNLLSKNMSWIDINTEQTFYNSIQYIEIKLKKHYDLIKARVSFKSWMDLVSWEFKLELKK